MRTKELTKKKTEEDLISQNKDSVRFKPFSGLLQYRNSLRVKKMQRPGLPGDPKADDDSDGKIDRISSEPMRVDGVFSSTPALDIPARKRSESQSDASPPIAKVVGQKKSLDIIGSMF